MSVSNPLPNIELFNDFIKDPKNCTMEMVKGSKVYLQNSIKKVVTGPTNTTLIFLFEHFSQGKIKEYIFKAMRKSILLELALAIVEEIIANGLQRAKTIELVLTGEKTKNKSVSISEEKDVSDEFPVSSDEASFIRDIDEASFHLRDSSGSSPGSKITSGGGADDAAFRTPVQAKKRKSIASQLDEVTKYQ